MNDSVNYFFTGSLFIVASGIIYTIERLSSYVYWLALVITGEYPVEPKAFSIFSNFFTSTLFFIGIIFMILHYVKKK